MLKNFCRVLAFAVAISLFAFPVCASTEGESAGEKAELSVERPIDIVSHTINRVTAEIIKAEKEGRELKALAEKKAEEEKKAAEEKAAQEAALQAQAQAQQAQVSQPQQYSEVAYNQSYDNSYQNYDNSYQDYSNDYSQSDYSQAETHAETPSTESSEQKVSETSSEPEATASTANASSSSSGSTSSYNGTKLNAVNGMINGPSGTETYYNLNMSGVIDNMQSMGIQGDYWVRDDGVKMYGDYVMAAANLDTHPYGSIVESSLGQAIVVDTGDFAEKDANQLDIAVDW